MLVTAILLIAITSIFAATFRIRDTVLTRGLQNAQYDNRLAVVVGDPIENALGQTRYAVIVWMGLDNPQGAFSSGRINIKPENLVSFNYGDWNLRPEKDYNPAIINHVARIHAYSRLIVFLEQVVDGPDRKNSEIKLNLLVGAVHKEFGIQGMLSVAACLPDHLKLAYM